MPSADEDDVGAGLFTHKAHVFFTQVLDCLVVLLDSQTTHAVFACEKER